MSRGATAPVEQQDIERLGHKLEAILKELRGLRADLQPSVTTAPQCLCEMECVCGLRRRTGPGGA